MSAKFPPFKTAFFDPTGLGFGHCLPGFRYYPARCIAGVSCNQKEDLVYFVNRDGLVIPLEHNRHPFAEMLKRAVRYEFGRIVGDGQFAMKSAQYQALAKAGLLKEWITYWFADPEPGFADDPAVYAAFRAKCVREACEGVERFYQTANDIHWPENLRSAKRSAAISPDAHAQLIENRRVWLELEIKRCAENEGKECDELQAQQLDLDRRITAWLRGDVGHPPLLALMKGAA